MVRESPHFWKRWRLHVIPIFGGKSLGAQFIIATHSPILLAFEDATIYSFDHGVVSAIDYKETEHYQIYRRFLLER